MVAGLRQTAAWLDGYPDPETGCAGDPATEKMLAHYDGLLLMAARMLDVAVPAERPPLGCEERAALLEALSAAALDVS